MSNFPQIEGGTPANSQSAEAPMLSAEETRIMHMSRGERDAYFRQIEENVQRRAAIVKEYEIKRQIAEDTEHSLSKNLQYQRMLRGEHPTKWSSEAPTPNHIQAAAQPFAFGAPQALIDSIPIFVGGIQLGPKQAQDMVASGQISKRDYDMGLAKELEAYGYANPFR